jgi:hypothetical protein
MNSRRLRRAKNCLQQFQHPERVKKVPRNSLLRLERYQRVKLHVPMFPDVAAQAATRGNPRDGRGLKFLGCRPDSASI